MNNKILIVQLLVLTYRQECSIGCLKCNGENQCLVCDTTDGYSMNGAVCQQSTIQNCITLGQNGLCLQCQPDYLLDLNTQNCIRVTPGSRIPNCHLYNSVGTCVVCVPLFYVVAGSCVPVSRTVSNCQFYSNSGECRLCDTGYVSSMNRRECVRVPFSNNCLFYTFLACRRCKEGFSRNENLYFDNYNSLQRVQDYLSQMVSPRSTPVGNKVCQPIKVANCVEFVNFDSCRQCRPGFYLADGRCFAFPANPIIACEHYSSLTRCASCFHGFHLFDNKCLLNQSIGHCLKYSQASSETTCVECERGFYVRNNKCVQRVLSTSIEGCLRASESSDVCSQCETGYTPTSDQLKCLREIENCAQYIKSDLRSERAVCGGCREGHYLFSENALVVCKRGSVDNCQVYQTSSNACMKCLNGHYLANRVCSPHQRIDHCETYHDTNPNFCSTCARGFYKFDFTTVCVQTTPKKNCEVYSVDASKCETCRRGFYHVVDECQSVPSLFTNCLKFLDNACSVCREGFMVNTLPIYGTCVLPLSYVHSSKNSPCSAMTDLPSGVTATWTNQVTQKNAPLTCLTCQNYMYPYSPSISEAVCVSSNQLKMYDGFASIPNCKRYGMSYKSGSSRVVCMECNSGFFVVGYQTNAYEEVNFESQVNPNGLRCASTCSFTTNGQSDAVIVDDFFGFVNVCIPFTSIKATADLQLASGAIQFPGTCRRYGRYRLTRTTLNDAVTKASGLGSASEVRREMMNRDYRCISPAPSSGTPLPSNYLYLDNSSTAIYQYERVQSSGARTSEPANGIGWDFSTGYSNTVDTSLPSPSVLNYKGLLEAIDVSNEGSATNPLAGGNSLSSCDVLFLYTNAGVSFGYAFDHMTLTGFYNTLAKPTAGSFVAACLRCSFGFELQFQAKGVAADNPVFPSCVAMTNCDNSPTVYGGLTTFLNSVLSCHQCSLTNNLSAYPSLWIETRAGSGGVIQTTAASTFVGWTIDSVYSSVSTVSAHHGFKCANAPSSVYIDSATPSGSISQCGVYGHIKPITTMGDGNGSFVTVTSTAVIQVCLACLANHYPVYGGASTSEMSFANPTIAGSGLPGYYVKSCLKSMNCKTSITSSFNSCSKCDDSKEYLLSPSFFAFQDFTLTNCFETIVQHCFILNPIDISDISKTNTCLVCKSGHFMNEDFFCDRLVIPNQSSQAGFVNSVFANWFFAQKTGFSAITAGMENRVRVRLGYLLRHSHQASGVTACEREFVQFPIHPWNPRLCVWSSYLYNNTGSFQLSSKFVKHCIRFNVTSDSGSLICGGCKVGYIPTSDGLSCVESESVVGCSVAQSGGNNGLCSECSVSRLNVNGQCVSVLVPNCAVHVNTRWSVGERSLACRKCLSGFYLSADGSGCLFGEVNNCDVFERGQSRVCQSCLRGFVLLKLANNESYCFPFPSSLNCLSLQDSSSTSGSNHGTISCSKCVNNATHIFGARNWKSLGMTNMAQTLCMGFNPVANCLRYDQSDPVVTLNSFECLECSEDFYYSKTTKKCLKRSKRSNLCASYSLSADSCLQCRRGYVLVNSEFVCVENPTGIHGCAVYLNPSTCQKCLPGYYLSMDQCFPSIPIANCETYAANNLCIDCLPGFYLANATSCVRGTASNCQTYLSMSACLTCPDGYGLQTKEDVTSCVVNSLPFCLVSTKTFPFKCLTCTTGYFPSNNGTCLTITQSILNCVVYDTSSTCSRCQSGSILSVSRTSCISSVFSDMVDANCLDSVMLNDPVCAECQFGFYFGNSSCLACDGKSISGGCLTCDPLRPWSCLICKPRYFMNSTGHCNPKISFSVQQPANSTVDRGASKVGILVILLNILLVFN